MRRARRSGARAQQRGQRRGLRLVFPRGGLRREGAKLPARRLTAFWHWAVRPPDPIVLTPGKGARVWWERDAVAADRLMNLLRARGPGLRRRWSAIRRSPSWWLPTLSHQAHLCAPCACACERFFSSASRRRSSTGQKAHACGRFLSRAARRPLGSSLYDTRKPLAHRRYAASSPFARSSSPRARHARRSRAAPMRHPRAPPACYSRAARAPLPGAIPARRARAPPACAARMRHPRAPPARLSRAALAPHARR